MTDKPYRTKSGRTLTDADIETLADEVTQAPYEPASVRKRGRPTRGDGPAENSCLFDPTPPSAPLSTNVRPRTTQR